MNKDNFNVLVEQADRYAKAYLFGAEGNDVTYGNVYPADDENLVALSAVLNAVGILFGVLSDEYKVISAIYHKCVSDDDAV